MMGTATEFGEADMAARPSELPDLEAADEILGRVPLLQGRPRSLELLTGGLTNRNYQVRITDEDGSRPRYVARFSSAKSALLHIDRDAEAANTRTAAARGIGPAVAAYVPDDALLLVDWIEGRTLTDADLDDADTLARIALLARSLHNGPPFVGEFDMFAIQRRYLSIVTEQGFRIPADYREYEPHVRRIEQALTASAPSAVPCHCDLLAANIMDDGERLWFIDYEYSGNADPCFELGNIWSEAALSVAHLEHLVTAYFGAPSRVQTARAWLFGLMAKYGWTLWASIQDAVSDVNFDFWEWGMEKYERARAEFASPLLEEMLETITDSLPSSKGPIRG